MNRAAATNPALPPAASPPREAVSWRAQMPMAMLLATALTIYMRVGWLVLEQPGWGAALVELALTWIAQFSVALATLATVAALYPRWLGAGPLRARRFAAVTFVGALVAMAVQVVGLGLRWDATKGEMQMPHPSFFLWSLSLAVLIVLAHHFGERSRHAAAALHDAQLARIGLERELASARTQLLQAQVEPHFIFNALANVRRLMRTDALAARTLLADLLRYLEEALPRLRDENTTLGREAELVRAYLAVHQVRMGPRLQFDIDVPDALAAQPMPPMLLLTLVENALKHGVQPLVEGGSVQVSARAAEGRIEVRVADTGRGMGSSSGGGTGLANVRARLRAMYGPAASLALAINEPRGVIATVTLPAHGA
jgi:signal transduction histidine kinase